MNLYEYSQINNTELGIRVDKEIDPALYDRINETANRIVRLSQESELEIKKVERPKTTSSDAGRYAKHNNEKKEDRNSDVGYCIRCGEKIGFNPNRPLCDKCYPIWAKFGDTKYLEKYYHVCGKDDPSHKSSYEKPISYPCQKAV
jgi:hypothetical protein